MWEETEEKALVGAEHQAVIEAALQDKDAAGWLKGTLKC